MCIRDRIYNDFVKYQDKKGVGHWIFNKLGSTPVYLSTVNPETRVKVATNLLHLSLIHI